MRLDRLDRDEELLATLYWVPWAMSRITCARAREPVELLVDLGNLPAAPKASSTNPASRGEDRVPLGRPPDRRRQVRQS